MDPVNLRILVLMTLYNSLRGLLSLNSLPCWFSNTSFLYCNEELGADIQLHLENNAYRYPCKPNGAKMWVIQTLDIHPMLLDF